MISGSIILLGFLLYAIPRLTRPGLLFGVTVDPAFRESGDARRALRRYEFQIAIHIAVALALGFALSPPAGMLWLLIGGVWAFVIAHRASMPHAAAQSAIREVDLAPRSESSPLATLLAIAPLALLGLLALYTSRHWDLLPESIPIHYGLHGADRWVARSPRAVYGLIFLHGALCLTLLLLRYGLLHASRRLATSGPAAQAEMRFRQIILWLLIALEYHVAALAWVMLFSTPHAAEFWGIGIAAVMGIAVLALPRLGQGGSRLAPGAAGDRTPDSCWKWGLFYINPDDPALFVEKRFGIGYTINLGHSQWWVILVVTALPLAISFYLLR